MRLFVEHILSVPSASHNDDRTGYIGNLAWVIDGATDIAAERLMPGPSDAAWLAAYIDGWLYRNAGNIGPNLTEIVNRLSTGAMAEFVRSARRTPHARHENPSAAGIVVRVNGEVLEVVSLGDCALLVEEPDGTVLRAGVPEDAAGDPALRDMLTRATTSESDIETPAERRARLMPHLRAARDFMNRPDGYGVFATTVTPPGLIDRKVLDITPGTRFLIASDGYMRLTDVYRACSAAELLDATFRLGPLALIAKMRAIESDDQSAARYPQAKTRDDASVLAGVVEAE